MQAQNFRSPILCIAGLDPSGGAGIQADIETISACGGHALSIASCLTVQNTLGASEVVAVEPEFIYRQADNLINDFNILACKVGVIPNASIAQSIGKILRLLSGIPVVLDPVLSASLGIPFSDNSTLNAIQKYVLPYVSIITPNHYEVAALSQCDGDEETQCRTLCSMGPDFVLLTGADNQTTSVINSLYSSDGAKCSFTWDRLPNQFHGSGCTLSSAIAYYLTQELSMQVAVEKAQQYTANTLKHAESLGKGQWIPNRNITIK